MNEKNKKYKKYKIDLHIHTCLSPCADILMTPGNIIARALKVGLDIIAITDHNSAGNVETAVELSKNKSIKIIPGMEVESSEEVHMICLFEQLENLLIWEGIVKKALPVRENDEDFFGYQLITDKTDDYVAKEKQLLVTATDLSVKEIVEEVNGLGGIVIPSHVDRPYNSIIANLGFIPPDLDISTVEISKRNKPKEVLGKFPFLKAYSYIVSSDSHSLNDIKPWTEVYLKEGSLKQIIDAIKTM